MKNNVGFGLIGAGTIAPWHLRGIKSCSQARLAAVADVNLETAKKLSAENDNVPFSADYHDLLRRPDVDVVSILVPSAYHGKITEDAARAGKHVLVEKPMEITLAAADKMIAACKKHRVKLGVVFQRRAWESVRVVREAMQAEKLGKAVLAECLLKNWRSQGYYVSAGWRGTWAVDGGGALMNQGIHGIDVLLNVMGEVESVFAYADHLVRKIEVEDTAVAVLKFKNGAFGTIVGTTSVNPSQPLKISFHGSLGTIILSDNGIETWKTTDDPEKKAEKTATEEGMKNPDNQFGHSVLIADMAQAVLEDREPMIPGSEGRKSLELILAIYQSAKTGKEVKLPLR